MPGIFGVIEFSVSPSERLVRELESTAAEMAAAMHYERHYSSVTRSCPSFAAVVGRTSLLSSSPGKTNATTPATVQTLSLTTGEETCGGAPESNPSVETIGPGAAALHHLYQQHGPAGVRLLAGIHAGVVVNARAGECVLFTDKYGKERIFLHQGGNRLFFASEAKAILAVAPETRAFDLTGLAEFLSCGCTLGTNSLYRQIEVLGGGTAVVITPSGVCRQRYFTEQDQEQLVPVSPNEFLEGFSDALCASVNGYVQRGPKVAISLTGGLDSRIIMAVLDAPPNSIPTYTFSSMYRRSGDVRVAQQVAKACSQPHHTIELGDDFLRTLPQHFERAVHVADGYLGFSAAAELYVNRQARAFATARMTGNWGGEVMRGVRAFKCVLPKGDFLPPELITEIGQCDERLRSVSAHPVSAALFQQAPMQGYGRNAIERSQLVMRHPFLEDSVVDWLYRAPANARAAHSTAEHIISRRPSLLDIRTERGLMGKGDSKVVRALREVLIKAEYLTSHGAPHWMARLSKSFPPAVVERRFLGIDKFQHFRFWTRHALAPFVRETLVRRRNGSLDDCFDMRRVGAMVEDHISGRANYLDAIDKLLTLAAAEKMLLRPEVRRAA